MEPPSEPARQEGSHQPFTDLMSCITIVVFACLIANNQKCHAWGGIQCSRRRSTNNLDVLPVAAAAPDM